MLLRAITVKDLANILFSHKNRSPQPGLLDPGVRRRARSMAKANGLWERLEKEIDPQKDIPVFKRSDFRNYQRNGNRAIYSSKEAARVKELGKAHMALWLDHPQANLDLLQDLLWSYCDNWTWKTSATEGRAVGLGSASLGAILAEIIYVHRAKLEEEVFQRVLQEIEKRVFALFVEPGNDDWWHSCRNNWNAVCNGEVIRAALFCMEDPTRLAQFIHGAINNLTYYLDGFADDGACDEGPGYWSYGFSSFARVALALYERTGHEINLMQGEKIEKICRYPLALNIDGPLWANFSDSHLQYIPAEVALTINRFFRIPELYALCKRDSAARLKIGGLQEYCLYDGKPVQCSRQHPDVFLPALGIGKMYGKAGRHQLAVVAIAGGNGAPHNHNDIGNFIVARDGIMLLDDPGCEVYTARTFSEHRYDSIFCNAMGHSVPVINGRTQVAGGQYSGRMDVQFAGQAAKKVIAIDLGNAYPKGAFKEYHRTLRLDVKSDSLTIEDSFLFNRNPESLTEVFITCEPARVIKGGKSVRIGKPGRGGILESLGGGGKFSVATLTEESKDSVCGKVIRRITWRPDLLTKKMQLSFRIK